MVLVQTSDGIRQVKESWATFKADQIQKIILTDGYSLKQEISGFNYYCVEKDAITTTTGMSQDVKETVYCIIDISEMEKQLLDELGVELSAISASGKDVSGRMEKCRDKYEYFKKILERSRVHTYSLGIVHNRVGDTAKIDPKGFKRGSIGKKTLEQVLGKYYRKRLKT